MMEGIHLQENLTAISLLKNMMGITPTNTMIRMHPHLMMDTCLHVKITPVAKVVMEMAMATTKDQERPTCHLESTEYPQNQGPGHQISVSNTTEPKKCNILSKHNQNFERCAIFVPEFVTILYKILKYTSFKFKLEEIISLSYLPHILYKSHI